MRGARLLFVVACGCGDGRDAKLDAPAPSIDAFVPMDTPACNSLVQAGSDVAQQRVAQDPPAPTGGTVPDGTYVLTADTVYTGQNGLSGPSGQVSQRTTSCSSLVCQIVYKDANGSGHETVTMTINGTNVTIVQTCGGSGATIPSTISMSSSPVAVELGQNVQIGTRVLRYELL